MATPKTTKKKAAKKTYPPTKKTVPKPKWMTARELSVIMAESQARMDARHAKTEAAIDRLSECHAKTEAAIAETSAEIRELAAEVKTLTEEGKETRKVLQETLRSVDKMSKKVDNLSDNVGCVNNRLGRIIELVVAPKIRHDINAAGGHNFSHVETNTLIRGIVGGRKEDIAEVDVLLRGPDEVMAVELKARLRENNVQDHVDRLQNLREHEEEADIKGKKLLGAVGGVVIDEKAKNLAKQRGLYIIEIREEKEAIDIEKPETCRAW